MTTDTATMTQGQDIRVATRQGFLKLSYYTLCRLQETTHFADPINGLPIAIARGEFEGIVTVDDLGNFISFR